MKKIPKKALYIIFILLLILVLILGIVIITLNKQNNDNQKVDMVVPILDKKSNAEFNISTDENKSNKIYYTFKITNYRGKDINKKEINYNIKFDYNDNIKLKLYKNTKKEKLINNETNNINLRSNKKEEQLYKLEIDIPDKKKDISVNIIIKKQK